MEKRDAQSLSQEIFKIIVANNLDINKCIGQCYDCNEWQVFWGTAKNSKYYTTCYVFPLLCTFGLINTIENIPLMVRFFNTIQDLYTFLMNSTTRYE